MAFQQEPPSVLPSLTQSDNEINKKLMKLIKLMKKHFKNLFNTFRIELLRNILNSYRKDITIPVLFMRIREDLNSKNEVKNKLYINKIANNIYISNEPYTKVVNKFKNILSINGNLLNANILGDIDGENDVTIQSHRKKQITNT